MCSSDLRGTPCVSNHHDYYQDCLHKCSRGDCPCTALLISIALQRAQGHTTFYCCEACRGGLPCSFDKHGLNTALPCLRPDEENSPHQIQPAESIAPPPVDRSQTESRQSLLDRREALQVELTNLKQDLPIEQQITLLEGEMTRMGRLSTTEAAKPGPQEGKTRSPSPADISPDQESPRGRLLVASWHYSI